MGFFDFLKRRSKPQKPAAPSAPKEEVFRKMFMQLAEEAPSKHFASGVVFDFVRQNHDQFAAAVAGNNLRFLQLLFAEGYNLYLNDPGSLGVAPGMVNKDKNDTNPMTWNMSVQTLAGTDRAFLCFMPVQDDTFEARIFGIILGKQADGYYYCMLNKDKEQPSEVKRNNAMLGIETVGTVNGRGFELMNSFLECISKNYYA